MKQGVSFLEMKNFFHTVLGTKLECKTNRFHESQRKSIIPLELKEDIEALVEKFGLIEYIFYPDVNNSEYVVFEYIEMYFEDEKEKEENYYRISSEISALTWDQSITYPDNYVSTSRIEYGKFNINEPNFVIYTYFIFDWKNLDSTKSILRAVYGNELPIEKIEVKNEEYGIDELGLFVIHETTKRKEKNSVSEKIRSHFWQSRINLCAFTDKNGHINFMSWIRDEDTDDWAKKGFREDLKLGFLSTWEANVARILNYKQIPWEYEKQGFPLSDAKGNQIGYYFPDFFISEGIIEVKGFWDQRSLSKVRQYKDSIEYPKMYVVDSDMYFTLEKVYANLIETWEYSASSSNKVSEIVKIVGVQRPERLPHVKALNINDEIVLERDSNNPYDMFAIKAVDLSGNLIGYMAKEWASVYADKMDLGMEYRCTITNIDKTFIEIRIQRTNQQENIVFNFFEPK